jgi:hypothetical protein
MSEGIITDNVHFAVTQQDFIDLMNHNAELEQEIESINQNAQTMCDRLTAENELLLKDKDASPAIIAGYREYNKRLREALERIAQKPSSMNYLIAKKALEAGDE